MGLHTFAARVFSDDSGRPAVCSLDWERKAPAWSRSGSPPLLPSAEEPGSDCMMGSGHCTPGSPYVRVFGPKC